MAVEPTFIRWFFRENLQEIHRHPWVNPCFLEVNICKNDGCPVDFPWNTPLKHSPRKYPATQKSEPPPRSSGLSCFVIIFLIVMAINWAMPTRWENELRGRSYLFGLCKFSCPVVCWDPLLLCRPQLWLPMACASEDALRSFLRTWSDWNWPCWCCADGVQHTQHKPGSTFVQIRDALNMFQSESGLIRRVGCRGL